MLKGTAGTAPEAGIDFEPNGPTERLVNCVMRRCSSENNRGLGYHFYLNQLDASSPPISIRLEDCVSRGTNSQSVNVSLPMSHRTPVPGQIDPDVQTARAGGLVVSSGAKIQHLQTDAQSARFQLAGFAGEPSHTLVSGFKPGTVRVNGQPLPAASAPLKREPGWWWDAQRQRLYLTVPHSQREAGVELIH